MGVRITELPQASSPIDASAQYVMLDDGTSTKKATVAQLQGSVSAAGVTYDNTTSGLSAENAQSAIDELADEKVDKIDGKGLSTNDYTDTDKTKLSSIEANAEVNVQSDWNQTDNSADSYIRNKPTIPAPVVIDPTITEESTNPVESGAIYAALAGKVDAEDGKGLSTEDFTTDDMNKLSGIADGAEVNTIESITMNGVSVYPDQDKNVALTAATTDPATGAIVTVINPANVLQVSAGSIWIETDES